MNSPPDPTGTGAVIAAAHGSAMDRGDDGYLDPVTGFFVMTEGYHLSRGTCCGNRCRHCPYDHEACAPGSSG